MRDDNYKDAFRGFTHNYLNSEESIKEIKIKNNNSITREAIKCIKFNNPHLNISNISINNQMMTKENLHSVGNNLENKNSENKILLSSVENKFLRMKKQSACSSSTSSLLRQYKITNNSQNSTNTSINYLKQRTASISNIGGNQ